MTPFQKAGYTSDTRFKVLVDEGEVKAGDIVRVQKDDGSEYPFFLAEDGREECLYLPGTNPDQEELEVISEPETTEGLPVNISMTLEEGVALQELLDNIASNSLHGELLSSVGHKVDEELEGKVKEVHEWDYYDLGQGYDLKPCSGSFEDLLKAMLPNKEKEEALAKAEDLRKQLEELEKQIAEMGA